MDRKEAKKTLIKFSDSPVSGLEGKEIYLSYRPITKDEIRELTGGRLASDYENAYMGVVKFKGGSGFHCEGTAYWLFDTESGECSFTVPGGLPKSLDIFEKVHPVKEKK